MNFDYDELYKWIDDHPINRQKKNINRDFSDAVPLAEILKQHFPKLVELHNYSPQNSFSQKIINWQTINKKVLNKLHINVTPDNMELLAKGAPGAVEKLLYEIKTKIETKAAGDKNMLSSSRVFYLDGLSNYAGSVVPVKVKNGSKIVDQKMMPSELYDQMADNLIKKEEAITTLKNKVEHLEKLLEVKDERIQDLTRQIQTVNEAASATNLTSPRTRFFGRIF